MRGFALTLAVAAFGAIAPADLPSQARRPAASAAALDSIARAAYRADEPGAAVLVVHRGRTLLREGYGLASVELGVRMRPEHIFRIGSVTKQFTGVAILMLAEEGKLALDDPITKFLPDYPTQGRTVTIEHLLAHTSGIRSYTSMPSFVPMVRTDLSLDSLIAVFAHQPFDFEPGTRFAYNNSGYVLLGAIIEKASGMKYADFLRTRIFEPLGMTSTSYDETGVVLRNRIPGYALQGGVWRNAEYISMTQPHAAGSLMSSVDDLARWTAAIHEQKLLSALSWRRAFTPIALNDGRSTGYGAGWFMGTLGDHATIEHGGGIFGFVVSALYVPEQQLFVTVLTNAAPPRNMPDAVALQLARRVLGVPDKPPAIALAPARLDEYVGVYRIDSTTTRTISRTDDRLFSQRSGGNRFEIYPIGPDRFAFRESESIITFSREGDRVTAMQLQPRIGLTDRALRESDVAAAAASPGNAPAATPPQLSEAILARYVGNYQLAPNFVVSITRDGTALYGQATGQSRFDLVPETDTRFRLRQVDATIEFHLEADRATALTLHQGGQAIRGRRQ